MIIHSPHNDAAKLTQELIKMLREREINAGHIAARARTKREQNAASERVKVYRDLIQFLESIHFPAPGFVRVPVATGEDHE